MRNQAEPTFKNLQKELESKNTRPVWFPSYLLVLKTVL